MCLLLSICGRVVKQTASCKRMGLGSSRVCYRCNRHEIWEWVYITEHTLKSYYNLLPKLLWYHLEIRCEHDHYLIGMKCSM